MSGIRLAIVTDYLEERWPSMDLVSEMLLANLSRDFGASFEATRVCPEFSPFFSRGPMREGGKAAFNADRLLNRMWHYPRHVRRLRDRFDLFHVLDHSYSQLLSELPGDRTIVTCHDLDAFRCLFDGERDPRPRFFRTFARRILDGFTRAARIVCDSRAVMEELLANRLAAPECVRVVHNGVDPACSPEPDPPADTEADALTRSPEGPILLHVGSASPRKRIDLVLRIFSEIRKRFPGIRLVRCGGALTAEQQRMAEDLSVADAIVSLPFVSKPVLAAVYRRAALLLMPSEREGFGFPVVEAMACGTPVVASDIAALREVGGEAAVYCPVEGLSAWVETVTAMLKEKDQDPARWSERSKLCISRASAFSWTEYTREVVSIYRELIN